MVVKKAPNPIDKHVGSRVRMRRMMLSMSQEKLGDALGLTFQQVQKYERGANRVGANRLARIAAVLDVSVTEFFESVRTKSPGLKSPIHLLAEPGAWQVLEACAHEPSPRVRSCIVKLMESIADRNPEAKARVARPRGVDPGDRRKFPSRR